MMDKEIELRGQVLSLSLKLEEDLSRVVYTYLRAGNKEPERTGIFLDHIINYFTFSKKLEILKSILKTKELNSILKEYLLSKPNVLNSLNVEKVEDLKIYLITELNEVKRIRNIIAHGINISDGFPETSKTKLILMNKFKSYKFDENALAEFSKTTLRVSFILAVLNDRQHKKLNKNKG